MKGLRLDDSCRRLEWSTAKYRVRALSTTEVSCEFGAGALVRALTGFVPCVFVSSCLAEQCQLRLSNAATKRKRDKAQCRVQKQWWCFAPGVTSVRTQS